MLHDSLEFFKERNFLDSKSLPEIAKFVYLGRVLD